MPFDGSAYPQAWSIGDDRVGHPAGAHLGGAFPLLEGKVTGQRPICPAGECRYRLGDHVSRDIPSIRPPGKIQDCLLRRRFISSSEIGIDMFEIETGHIPRVKTNPAPTRCEGWAVLGNGNRAQRQGPGQGAV